MRFVVAGVVDGLLALSELGGANSSVEDQGSVMADCCAAQQRLRNDGQPTEEERVGGIQDDQVRALAALHEAQQKSTLGWATDESGITFAAADQLRRQDLVETADGDTLSRLASAQPGSALPQWAARLTRTGLDTLVYLPLRRAHGPATPPAVPRDGTREVILLPSEMDIVRLYVQVGDQLLQPPPSGLAEAVRTAQCPSGTTSRWALHVTAEEAEHIAYSVYLESIAHSARPHNRIAREYKLQHRPR
ncbi:hypothetical protein IPZ58_27850 [Streptomyces roseoverticillatus]|uniref:DUF6417 family protein n=1 Tax=Streptomyces roseoverticillatus TaxID=66429 RepID=UPI001F42A381|nr:DUF6417 family protein [Streptomyces roseoverticillatus]MCF3105376.1 hypothetical protein [Streptomyces roseoverticillatus]